MYWTKTLIPTMKETPEGAEIPSHVLMLRAGMVSQVMAGAYTYLPLGFRALKKAEQIVREEMDAAGAVELAMPTISPRELWERTGRVEAFGEVLVQVTLHRPGRKVQLVLGPTHEEVVTELVARHVSSYRQMPITLYQITPKYRNEERPRFGVLRTSEFLMKDAYSFDPSVESLGRSYEKMYAAYCRIFDRCGLDYLAVEAESGPIGGEVSHEFMVPASNGEDAVLHCSACGYAANREKAEIGSRDFSPTEVPLAPLEKVDTPGASTIEQVSGFLKCRPADLIKTLIYLADGRPIAVLIRGDHDANEGKIRRTCSAVFGAEDTPSLAPAGTAESKGLAAAGTAAPVEKLELAPPEVIERVTGAPVGFAGPVGMKEKIPILADLEIERMVNAATGANAADAHLTGVNSPRDFQPDFSADLRDAVDGDPCPRCSNTLSLRQAIEVGHVFKLGTKYSEALGARFLDAEERLRPIVMGCYGIGVNRIIAALVENSHDGDGIVWPVSLAPYEVLIVPVKVPDEELMTVAADMHDKLAAAGIDVLLDDRDCRAGVKFKDADLIGVPLRVVVGQRGLREGKLEIKWRWSKESEQIPLAAAAEKLIEFVRAERAEGKRFREGQA